MRSVEELKNIRPVRDRTRIASAISNGIRGKRVLVRVDFNVPIERGKVMDDTKIVAAVSTVEWLLKKGAKVILMTHLGRPRASARDSSAFGLRMTATRFGELLKKKVQLVEKWDFEKIQTTVKKMKSGDVLMLPNVRLHPGEATNSAGFAKDLVSLGDFYVNEAFPECHRRYASIVGVPKLLPAYAGLRLMQEVEILSRVLHKSEKPLVVMMGGGKITDKMAMLTAMIKRADAVLVGGALATHFFKAMGYGVGSSRVETEGVRLAKKLIGSKKIVLPLDVVVGMEDGERAYVVDISDSSLRAQRSNLGVRLPRRAAPRNDDAFAICFAPYGIWDIGPQTILEYAKHIKQARTLIWNGPMGLYEVKRYSHGTLALGRLFAARSKGKAFGVAGGGETLDALKQTGLMDYVDFVSTGGGAMLEFLGGKRLPGIEALQYGTK